MLITVSKDSKYEKDKSRIGDSFSKKAENLNKRASKKKLQIDIALKKDLAKNKANWTKANKNLKNKSKKQMP